MLLACATHFGCGNNLVDDRAQPIAIVSTRLRPSFVYNYYDSIPSSKWNHPRQQWSGMFKQANPGLKEKAFYFSEPLEEMYYVRCTDQIRISSVYIGSTKQWLDGDSISDSERSRITKRFETEVLEHMENYGKLHALPDSLVFLNP